MFDVVCSEEVEKVKFLLKRESTKSMRYQIFSEGVVGQLQKMRWDESTKVTLLT